jgi:hypothetical protein
LAVLDRTNVTEVLPLNCGEGVPDVLEPHPVAKLTIATATKAERNHMPEMRLDRQTGASALIATS